MIERAAECLNHGGSNVLRATKSKLRSRRSLHSAFWSHGAGTINLPSWWMCLLQTPEHDDRHCDVHKKTSAAQEVASGLQKIFLDFLYPAQTVALIQRIQRSTRAHQRAAHNVKYRARQYTSTATAFISSSRSASNVFGGSSRENRSMVTTSGVTVHSGEIRTRLNELLVSKDHQSESCDALWQIHQDLLETSEPLSSQELVNMLRYLTASERTIDLERLLALFESIPIQERRAIHYSHAISAALALNDLGTAVDIHHETLIRLHGKVGTSAILRYAVMKQNWKAAVDTWSIFWDSKYVYYTRPDIWDGIEALPYSELIDRAASAVDFAISVAESSDPQQARNASQFTAELARRALRARAVDFDLIQHRRLVRKIGTLGEDLKIELWDFAMQQLLATGKRDHGHEALWLYRSLRKLPSFKPSEKLLWTILSRIYSIKNTSALFMMIEDFRKYAGKLKLKGYQKIVKRLAQAGYAEEVHRLFNEVCAEGIPPAAVWHYHSLLYVHFRRADTERVVQTFEVLKSSHGFVPDLKAYNIVISTFARVGDDANMLKWLAKLRQQKIEPDQTTYTTIMSLYADRGDREAVHEWLQQSKAVNAEPQMQMIDALVLANVNDGRLEEAEKLVEVALHMELNGSRTFMWNTIINAYALSRDLEKVSQLQRRMRDADVPMDGNTFAALITSLMVLKHPNSAWRLLNTVMPKLNIKRTAFHYALVMSAFLETKEYGWVFKVYEDMLRRNIAPQLGTQMSLLRATAATDKQKSYQEGNTRQTEFTLARQVFDQTIENLDPMELAPSGPRAFIGPQRLDYAFISRYFQHMIMLYSEEGAYDKVGEVYNRYTQIMEKFGSSARQDNPPVEILSALLIAHRRAGNDEEIERCWKLILEELDVLSRKARASVADGGWVLPARRFIINFPLHHYMSFLNDQGRLEDIKGTITDILTAGYDLDHGNWNRYIQYLSDSPAISDQLKAFEYCERKLIFNWPGWSRVGSPYKMRNMFKALARPARFQPMKRLPTYRTFVKLAAVYLRLEPERRRLWDLAPQTVDAVRELPKYDDAEQNEFLRGEN